MSDVSIRRLLLVEDDTAFARLATRQAYRVFSRMT